MTERTGSRRPAASVDDARALAADRWGLRVEVEELPGDSDRNYRLRRLGAADDDERFVLKIAGPWVDRERLDFRLAALDHVSDRAADGLSAARVVPTSDGERLVAWRDGEGRECRVHVLTYLPGKTLARVRPHTDALLESVGESLAHLDRALADFDPPGARRRSEWDLLHAGTTIRERLDAVDDPERRRRIEAVLEGFDERAAPFFGDLPSGVIHGDGNDYNLLVTGAEVGDPRISGIIDFGDMVHSRRIFEPAIAAAYAGLGKADPLGAAVRVVAGYHRTLPLEERELALLFDLVRARLAVTVTMAAYQRRLEPQNEYLSVSEAPAWRSLELLESVPYELAHGAFRVACGLEASPKHEAVTAWLRRHRGSFGKVVDGDLETAPIVDLSIGSPLSAELQMRIETDDLLPDEKEPLWRHVERLLEAPGVDVAIGRYDEPRLLYTTEQFSARDGREHPENRTIHIGVDLFQPPGSPIYAPLDGTVHSFADNRDPLDYGPTILLRHELDDPEIDPEKRVFYTLYGHLDRASLDGKFEGMKVARGDVIGRLGSVDVNGGWAPHLHVQILLEHFGPRGQFPGVAAPSDRRLWTSLCPDPDLLLALPEPRAGSAPEDPPPSEEVLERRRRVLGKNLSISYRKPLHIVAGRGCYLYDVEGRAYLDAVNNVPHVGHCRGEVVRAGQEQMAVLNTNTRYLHGAIVDYAERLAATFPSPLDVCVLCCTGSEANDLALRMARSITGGDDLVVIDAAYHGHTRRLIEASPYKFDGAGGEGAPSTTRVVPLPCGYRGPHKHGDPEIGRRYAEPVAEICAELAAAGRRPIFLAESILGCGGQVVLPPGFLEAAYAHVRAAGGVCIADEVQVGFGRVGSHMWAFETQGVVPDLVTLGKPIGNGHPLSAVILTEEIAEAFDDGMEYFNTFGGNPVSCRIGSAVLDVIEKDGLQEHARKTGALLLDRLRALEARHEIIGEVRGLGLFVGVELVRDRETLEPAADAASYVAERMRDHGILISTDGPLHNVLKIKPPMVFGEAEAIRLAETLDRILDEDPVRAAVSAP